MTEQDFHTELRNELMDKLFLSEKEAEQYLENKNKEITKLKLRKKSVEYISDHLMALAFAGK